MSVKLMTKVYDAHFHDITFEKELSKKSGEKLKKKITIVASSLKSIALALADNANDEGEGAYPGLTTLEDKTELSRHTVIHTLNALKHEKIIAYAGISKYGTNNYTLNREKIIEMSTWEKQTRKKVVKPLHPSEATSPDLVKPLPESSEATSPESSFNHHLNQLGANAPEHSEPPQHNPDPLDDFLAFERLKQERADREGLPLEVLTAIESFPPDCQHGARLMFERRKLAPPTKPRNGKGGDYADWINGIRDLVKLCAEYQVTLETGFDEFHRVWNQSPFPHDRPGSMLKVMRSALATRALRETPETTPPLAEEQVYVPNPLQRRPNFAKPPRALNHRPA